MKQLLFANPGISGYASLKRIVLMGSSTSQNSKSSISDHLLQEGYYG